MLVSCDRALTRSRNASIPASAPRIVLLPINKIDELARIKKGLSRLEQKLGHLPEPGEIAEEGG